MEARPIQSGDGCNETKLVPKSSVCIFPIFFINHVSDRDDCRNFNMAHAAMMSSIVKDVNSQSIVTSKTNECCQRFFSRRASITNQQYHEISGVENFGKSLALPGISETASQLIAGARQESSWY